MSLAKWLFHLSPLIIRVSSSRPSRMKLSPGLVQSESHQSNKTLLSLLLQETYFYYPSLFCFAAFFVLSRFVLFFLVYFKDYCVVPQYFISTASWNEDWDEYKFNMVLSMALTFVTTRVNHFFRNTLNQHFHHCTKQLGNLDTNSMNPIQNQELSLHLVPNWSHPSEICSSRDYIWKN